METKSITGVDIIISNLKDKKIADVATKMQNIAAHMNIKLLSISSSEESMVWPQPNAEYFAAEILQFRFEFVNNIPYSSKDDRFIAYNTVLLLQTAITKEMMQIDAHNILYA